MTLPARCQQLFLIWLVVALAINPFLVLPLTPGAGLYDNQRLIQISVVSVALCVGAIQLMSPAKTPFLFNIWLGILLIIFILIGLTSSTQSYSPRHAFFEVINFTLLIVIAWLIAAQIKSQGEPALDRLLMGLGVACFIYLLLALAMYIAVVKSGTQPRIGQLIVGYENYRFFNHVQTMSLPLLGLLAVRLHNPSRQRLWWTVTALWWMLLFVSGGRGTLLGLALGGGVAWWVLRQQALAWCRPMAYAALAGLAGYLVFYQSIPRLLGLQAFGQLTAAVQRSTDNSDSGRLALWERALEMIAASPWLGAGPNHFAHEAADIAYGAHPHSWALQIASEWGVPALLVLIAILFLAASLLIQLKHSIHYSQTPTLAAFIMGGVAILADGLVSGLIVTPASQLWIAVYLGCVWGWVLTQSQDHQTAGRYIGVGLAAKIVILPISIAMAVGLINGVLPELKQLRSNNELNALQQPKPRIMLSGNF